MSIKDKKCVQLVFKPIMVMSRNEYATPLKRGLQVEFEVNRILLSQPQRFDKISYYDLIKRQLYIQKQLERY
jgi:hypothetical protein